jgi:hypothetical protein
MESIFACIDDEGELVSTPTIQQRIKVSQTILPEDQLDQPSRSRLLVGRKNQTRRRASSVQERLLTRHKRREHKNTMRNKAKGSS